MKTRLQKVPKVSLAIAEKVIRDIARREGEGIRKRRSKTMIELFGPGYMVFDRMQNILLAGNVGGQEGQDGCGESLEGLAERYEQSENNTPWQKMVIAAIKAGEIAEAA